MTALLLPFAKRVEDSLLVSPAEVPRGKACGCVCPACETPVQARKGSEKTWHFAHAEGHPCANAYERSVHEMAKQMLVIANRLRLPAGVVVARDMTEASSQLVERRTVFEESVTEIKPKSSKRSFEGVTPDVALSTGIGELLVEVVVFHRLSENKAERLSNLGIPCLLIDLGRFRSINVNIDLLLNDLLEDPFNRFWVFHPKLEQTRLELLQLIHNRKEQKRQEREEALKLHRENETNWEKRRLSLLASSDGLATLQNEPAFQPKEAQRVLRWRASFPDATTIEIAQQELAKVLSIDVQSIQTAMSGITRRGELARLTPQSLVANLVEQLSCDEDHIYRFLLRAHLAIE